jgi:hypothetical protein
MKRLSVQSGANNLKFRGKILCVDKDYWILSGSLPDSEPPKAGIDARGTGVNEFVYWVTDNLLHDWC